MRILMIGLNDPAGMMIAFANAINRYTDHRARVISYRTAYNLNLEYDIEIPRMPEDDWGEIEALLREADVFHFHMLLDENYQLGPFRISEYVKGKRIIHHHHGTYDHQCFEGVAEDYRRKYKTLGRKVLVATPDLLEFLPEAVWQPNLVPLNDVEYLPRSDHLVCQTEIRLVQAPTRRWHKHTKEFADVTKRLTARHPSVRAEIIEGCSHRDCLSRKRRAHAVFDHMNGWFGISSLESLSQGVPVLAGLSSEVVSQIREFTGCETNPWVIVTTEAELEASFEELILDPAKRVAIGVESRRFMEQHWSEQKVVSELFKAYE